MNKITLATLSLTLATTMISMPAYAGRGGGHSGMGRSSGHSSGISRSHPSYGRTHLLSHPTKIKITVKRDRHNGKTYIHEEIY